MPVKVRRKRKGEKGKRWKIIEQSSGKIVGHSDTKKDAIASVRIKNNAVRRKK